MLVFSPPQLTQIFDSLITNYKPKFRDATPANTLYMLARFAALTCDHTWLEDLIIGATDAIEETFFVIIIITFGLLDLIYCHMTESGRRLDVPGFLALQHNNMVAPT
jgi:hypothetical protein